MMFQTIRTFSQLLNFSPQVFSIFEMKNHICTLFDNLSFFIA